VNKIAIYIALTLAAVALFFVVAFWSRPDPMASQGDSKQQPSRGQQDKRLKHLQALPYFSHSIKEADVKKQGVETYIRGKAHEGINLYYEFDHNMRLSGAYVMDMSGKQLLHESREEKITVFSPVFNGPGFIKVDLQRKEMLRYSAKRELRWRVKQLPHHEVTSTHRGTILVDYHKSRQYKGREVRFDGIVELDQNGKELSRWSNWQRKEEIFKYHPRTPLDNPGAKITPETPLFDYYHQNAIQELPETPLGVQDVRFRKGNWLVSLRNTNLVIILDQETKKIVWSYGPRMNGPDLLRRQHMPRMLKNGNIIIFDNGDQDRPYSRVVEINPATRKVVWEYKEDPPESWFCVVVGSVQRLPNGNTLIGDGANGRAIEVTREGEIVWAWYHPEVNKQEKRRIFYRIYRLSKEAVAGHLP